MWRRFLRRGVKRWLDEQVNCEPSEQENKLAGFLLFLFVILWAAAGPPNHP